MEGSVGQKTKIGGIIQNDQLASISVLAVKDRPGIAAAVLDALGQRNINVQFVVQVIDQSDQAQMVLCVDRTDLPASLAAIETIPQELIEAAQIDGASPFRRLRAITLPMTRQAFTITIFLTLVNSFKQFDVNVSLTGGGPSAMFMGQPIYGTQLLAMNIYNQGLKSNDMAGGQARAVVFFLVLVIVSIIQVSVNKKREIEL